MIHWSNDLLPSGSDGDIISDQKSLRTSIEVLAEDFHAMLHSIEGGTIIRVDEPKLGRLLRLMQIYTGDMSFLFTVSTHFHQFPRFFLQLKRTEAHTHPSFSLPPPLGRGTQHFGEFVAQYLPRVQVECA